MELFHSTEVGNLKWITPSISSAYAHMGPLVFSSPSMGYSACFASSWKPEHARIEVFHNEDSDEPKYYNVEKITFIINKKYVNLDKHVFLYKIDSGWFAPLHYDGDMEYISKKRAFVMKSLKMKWRDLLKHCKVEVVEI